MSSQQYQIAHGFCVAFLFYQSFSRGGHRYFAYCKFVAGSGAAVVMHASCRGEEVLEQKGRLKEKALNDHIEKFSISQISWSPTPGVFICCRAGGEQLAALSTVFDINNSVSPAAVLKLKVMTRSGVTEVTSGVASLTEMKLFTAASEVASPSEVELYCFLFAHLQYLGLFF